jgi:hypothetical protein
MRTLRSRFLKSSAAVATAATLAFWFTFGGPQVVRADDPASASTHGQEMVLVSAKSLDALEDRVSYLEQTVAALTKQQVDAHRLCASDESGAETCITKAQLDLVLSQAPRAEINKPGVPEEAEAWLTAAPLKGATPEPSSKLPTVASENMPSEQDPETTGTTNSAISGAAVVWYPNVEVYREPSSQSDE